MNLLRTLLVVVVVVALGASPAEAGKRRKRRASRPPPSSGPLVVPVEVAVGPIALVPSSPLLLDQPVFGGIRVEVAAVVDRELIRAHASRLPAWARGVAGSVNEVKVRPSWLALLPEELVISPQVANTGMYGAIWRPFGVSLSLLEQPGFRVFAGAAVDAVALVIHSTTVGVPAGAAPGAQSLTLVLRPGLNATLAGEWIVSKEWRLSAGWASDVFVPQAIGRAPWEMFPVENALFHLGGPYLMVHGRFPFTVSQ
jgi:hypothetical protein